MKDIKKEYECLISVTKKGDAYGVCKELKRDVFIPKEKTAGVFHGDKAIVAIEKDEKWLEGQVVRVTERAKNFFSGVLHKKGEDIWLTPSSKKAVVDIKIIGAENLKIEGNEMAAIEIVKWGDGVSPSSGKITKILGRAGENNAEMRSIVYDHGFEDFHSEAILEQADSLKDSINDEEIGKRRDFRNVPTFTIDPADAKDFDDAISIQRLENGNFEIGVHIADASHFVRPGTAIDKEARKRTTSIYLVDRVVPMLPEILSNNLCSLLPKKDRLTFSAVFELNDKGKIFSEWYGKTVINSDRRFTYEEAQEILERRDGEYGRELGMLNKIAKNLRQERIKAGSVLLHSVEIKFKLDENGKPVEIYKKEQKEAHKLVEEFMLLANRKVAEQVFKRGDDKGTLFVYRNHELPDNEKIEDLKEVLVNLGYKVNRKKTGMDSKEINAVIDEFEGRKEGSLVMWIILRSMAKADYSTKNIGHFGLAFGSYTHFTSPIRRYPDIMVHRLLDAHLKGREIENREDYEKMCKHSSEMERKAMNAERESIKYKQVEFMADKIGRVFTGTITGISEYGMYIEAKETLCEGMVAFRNMKDDYYSADKKLLSVEGQKRHKKYKLTDEVKVELVAADLKNRTIDFRIVN